MGIPGLQPIPFFGNLLYILKRGYYGFDLELKQKYGKLHGLYMGSVPVLVVHDEELLKQICVKEFQTFHDRLSFGAEGFPINKGLDLLKGEEWKRMRSFLTPVFTAGKLKNMTPLIQSCALTLQKRFMTAAENSEEIDLKSYCSPFSMDVIARTMFGLMTGAQENPEDEFYVNSGSFFKLPFSNPSMLFVYFWPKFVKIFNFFKPYGFFPKDLVQFYMSRVMQALEVRKTSTHEHHDFLSLILKSSSHHEGKISSTSMTLTQHEMMAQLMLFISAGADTTTAPMMFCVYFLAKHPEYQDQCRREIRERLGNEEPNFDNVNKLHFMDLCIQETLRICPPAMRVDRMANRDITLTDSEGRKLFIPKGLHVVIPLLAMQTDPELWDRPEEFVPERFEGEELERRKHNFHHIPFGAGPRTCIGMRLAMLKMKVALASVLSKVKVSVCDKTLKKLEFEPADLLDPKYPVIVRVEKL